MKVLPLFLVAGLALPTASLIGDVVASELHAALPDFEAPDVAPAAATPRTFDGEGLAQRRIFDLADPVVAAKIVTAPPPIPELSDGLPTELPIILTGTLVSTDLGPDMATLQVAGDAQIAVVGMPLCDGKAEVVAIARGEVLLREGERLTTVPFDTKPPAPAPAPPTKIEPAKPAQPTQPEPGVVKTGAYDYTVKRNIIEEAMKKPPEARILPVYEDDKYAGFKLVGMKGDSLLRQMGIRSGDTIRAVNGEAIDSPTKLLSLYEALKGQSHVEVEIERRGSRKTMRYTIE